MPLRDHFHPPLSKRRHWEGFYSVWLALTVQRLQNYLPTRFHAEPHIHYGNTFEVRVYDDERGLHQVAAVELVSPFNKDRPEGFATRCASYLQDGVSVVMIDVVTNRPQNLHAMLFHMLGMGEQAPMSEGSPLYAVAYRPILEETNRRVDLWIEPLTLGTALPVMPLWLQPDVAVPLELEISYEEASRVLRII